MRLPDGFLGFSPDGDHHAQVADAFGAAGPSLRLARPPLH